MDGMGAPRRGSCARPPSGRLVLGALLALAGLLAAPTVAPAIGGVAVSRSRSALRDTATVTLPGRSPKQARQASLPAHRALAQRDKPPAPPPGKAPKPPHPPGKAPKPPHPPDTAPNPPQPQPQPQPQPPPNQPPLVTFAVEPAAPVAGSPVVFRAQSSDADGQLVTLAWDLDADGTFDDASGPMVRRAFSVVGSYSIAVRATDDRGGSAVASRDVVVSRAPSVGGRADLPFMRPFPVVRLRGRLLGRSVVIDLLSVTAPRGARIRVRCRRCGVPRQRAAAATIARARTTRVRSMERRVAAGAVLQIYVTRAAAIGKYTSFSIRRGRAPIRHDRCLLPGGTRPIRCPG
jgi:hypothetical protein